MKPLNLPLHPGLLQSTRLRTLVSDAHTAPLADWALLAAFGALAAISSASLNLGIQRVPGHAILRVVFPIALGLAIVPRRGAGSVMGASAFVTAMMLRIGGLRTEGLGFGALTSLLATGPLLDFTLSRAHSGLRQYAAITVTGLVSNLMALSVRGLLKATGLEAPGRRPLMDWLAQASFTYVVCGLLAGFLSALVLLKAFSRADNSCTTPSRDEPPLDSAK